jgi:amino acid transporter
MARSLYGLFWFFVFLAIVNSTIANANAGVNVSTRTAYAMGRINAFPRFLAQVHPKHHSPVMAILTAFVITVAVTLGLGLGYDPVTAFFMVATALVIVLAAIYILMNACCTWSSPCSASSPSSPPGSPPRALTCSRSSSRSRHRSPTWAPGWQAS